jgi:hypothetical protein
MGVRSALSKIPPKAWLAIGCAVALLLGALWHQHRLHRHDANLRAEQKAADDKLWSAALSKAHTEALAWKAKVDQQAATIAQDERKQHEEAIRLNAAAADALRLRGPGAAAAHCGQGDHPGAAAAADRHGQAAPQTGAAPAQVPSGDWAVVPWGWLVTVVQEHDDLLEDVTRIEENDKRQRANWPK